MLLLMMINSGESATSQVVLLVESLVIFSVVGTAIGLLAGAILIWTMAWISREAADGANGRNENPASPEANGNESGASPGKL